MNDRSRPKAAPESSTTTTTSILPRPTVIYVARGTRPIRGGRETVTLVRFTLPAARRAAGDLDSRGRGPARIYSAEIREWTPVPREEPEGWWR